MNHHRQSIRLRNYDYSLQGLYYVTMCSQNRELYFGNDDIKDIIEKHWLNIPKYFNNIELDEWVVMPNHLHGIIAIVGAIPVGAIPVGAIPVGAIPVGAIPVGAIPVGAIHELPLQEDRRKMLLPKIIGKFKMNSSKEINILLNRSGQKLWQRNYYEHIIRDERSLCRIRQYIKNNPINWETDRNNPKNYKI